MQQEKRIQEKLQLQLAGDFVDHVIGSVFLGLDVYLAGLHANLVGSAVIGLGTVDDIGHVILLAAELQQGRVRWVGRGVQGPWQIYGS